MWGRLLGLLAGLALCGEAVVLWRPEVVAALPTPVLGPFTAYRVIIAALAGAVGLAVIVASLLREAEQRKTAAKPAGADWDQPAAVPIVQAQPILHETPAEPVAGHAWSPATVQADGPYEPVELAPFPAEAEHAAPAEAPAPVPIPISHPAPEPPSAPVAAATGERGTFLAAIDAADQMRAANRMDDALELYDGALALARRAHSTAPSDPAATRDLALALTNVADVHDRQGRLDPALSLHEESLGLRRSIAGQSPEDLAAQRSLSAGLERLADTREARGHRSRARDLFRERLPLAERLTALAPGDTGLAQDLTTTRERLRELDGQLEP